MLTIYVTGTLIVSLFLYMIKDKLLRILKYLELHENIEMAVFMTIFLWPIILIAGIFDLIIDQRR